MNRSKMLALALTGLLGAGLAHAEDPTPDTPAATHAARIAVTTCGACHGGQGVSQQPKFPRLAGQNGDYLAAQLKAFRAQTRGDADAVGYMWGMAAPLDDATIDALGAYYAAQRPPAGGPTTDAALVAAGQRIYENGVAAVGVPACAACHGPDAHGIGDFPRLAGQHAQYILKQLDSFQSNMRNVAVMHGVAQGLRVDEMRAVAAYLETRP